MNYFTRLSNSIKQYKQDSQFRELTNGLAKYIGIGAIIGTSLIYCGIKLFDSEGNKNIINSNEIQTIESKLTINSTVEQIPNSNIAKIDFESDGTWDAVIGPSGARGGTVLISKLEK